MILKGNLDGGKSTKNRISFSDKKKDPIQRERNMPNIFWA